MFTKLTSIEELHQIFIETLLNNTTKVTKITDGSVLNGVAFGVAKVAQKALKDIALVEAHLFPDVATGDQLDKCAEHRGISPRFAASGSSTYVRLVGAEGTEYLADTHTLTASNGTVFSLEADVTLGALGYAYAKVRSQTEGETTNVAPLSLNKIAPLPTGHKYLVNEFKATGGRETEQDDVFRQRIKQGANLAAKDTLATLDQLFMKVNSNVLKCFYQGHNDLGQVQIAVVTQNGVDLSAGELTELAERAQKHLAITDLRYFRSSVYGIQVKNIEWFPVDLAFRVSVLENVNVDSLRAEIQTRLAKHLDYRFWNYENMVEWDNLLEIVKSTKGVKYVPDNYFTMRTEGQTYQRTDLKVDTNKLPRLRGFLMLDQNGTIIQDLQGNLNPVFFPNNPENGFQETILN